jgi:holin-like protein
MVFGFTVLLGCQLLGEVVARGLGLPIPGPVLGLVFLFAGLSWQHRARKDADALFEARAVTGVGDALLANLSLLFIPAGVGVIEQIGVLKAQGLALGLAIAVSTPLTLAVTVLVFVGVKRLMRKDADGVRP